VEGGIVAEEDFDPDALRGGERKGMMQGFVSTIDV
jgi:hypothetical protein